MSNEPDDGSGVVSDITRHLGTIIRHMLPGVIVVGGTRIAYPKAFCAVDLRSWQHLLVLGVVTLAVGNGLFALNRCGVQQVLERVFYWRKIKGPIREDGRSDYVNDLANYVIDSFQRQDSPKGIRQHVELRVSTGFLLLTLGETALVFSLCHSDCSVLNAHRFVLPLVCAVAFPTYVWQFWITRRIDYFVVHPDKKRNSALQP